MNDQEPLFRFGLKTLCVWLVFIAVVSAAMVSGHEYWLSVMNLITLTLLCGAAILGTASRESKRIFLLTFFVFLVAHSLAANNKLAWLDIRRDRLPTYHLVRNLSLALHLQLQVLTAPGVVPPQSFLKPSRAGDAIGIGKKAASILVASIAAYLMRAIYVYSNRKRSNE